MYIKLEREKGLIGRRSIAQNSKAYNHQQLLWDSQWLAVHPIAQCVYLCYFQNISHKLACFDKISKQIILGVKTRSKTNRDLEFSSEILLFIWSIKIAFFKIKFQNHKLKNSMCTRQVGNFLVQDVYVKFSGNQISFLKLNFSRLNFPINFRDKGIQIAISKNFTSSIKSRIIMYLTEKHAAMYAPSLTPHKKPGLFFQAWIKDADLMR